MLEERRNISEREEEKPEVVFDDGFIECSCGCEGEYSYAISTENGKIMEKGRFKDGFRLVVDYLENGFYHLTIFDAMKRYTYSFYVK